MALHIQVARKNNNESKTMKNILTFVLAAVVSAASFAAEVAGVNLPESLSADDQALNLNGTGVRSKFFMDIYAAGLYLPEANKDGETVVSQDKPMALRLHITSSLLTAEKMESATREGFEQSTGGKTESIKPSIEKFIAAFKDEIKENDVFDLVYKPGKGVEVYKNSELKASAEGLDFKKALFGIWLSENAVQDDLKDGLLGS